MSQTHDGDNRSSTYNTPRWVKAFGIIALVLILLVITVLVTDLGGEHSPGRHTVPVEQEIQLDGTPGHMPPVEHGGQ